MVLRRVLVVDDEKNILTSLCGVLQDEGYLVESAKNGDLALHAMRKFAPDLVLLDIWMPGEDGIQVLEKIKKIDPLAEVIMMSGHGTIETAVKAIKLGAFDFLEKPIHFEKVLLLLNHAFELKELKKENRSLREELLDDESILTQSPAMLQVKSLIEQAGPSNGWVLISGERGTGKELVARSLHRASERAQQRFVMVPCGKITDENFDLMLSGMESPSQGRKLGKLEQADGGTLYLNDVNEMALKHQERLLNLLKSGRIQRFGGERPIDVDFRVIAATNTPLEPLVKAGKFHSELFHRLNVIPIVVPSLRQRQGDISALIDYFIKRYSSGRPKKVSEKTLHQLSEYSWPGNVRELKNWVERACILSDSNVIESPQIGI